MLVHFRMRESGDWESSNAQWEKICAIPGMKMVRKTTSMATHEAEFRVADNAVLSELRRKGEVNIIEQ